MIRHRKRYSAAFNALLSSPEMAVYLEPERKLDAKDEATLTEVEEFIRKSDYFLAINDAKINHDIPVGIDVEQKDLSPFKLRAAEENTPRRYRVYYDTPKLDAFLSGIEIRIEFPKTTEHGHVKPYKQTIKLGKAATEADPTFHRLEVSGRLKKAIPSFDASALDGNKKLSAFLKNYLDVNSLRPLLLLDTGRTRYYCRPDGCANTIVEFGSDRGQILTLNGYKAPILQLEPEVLAGDETVLTEISKRLTQQFNHQKLFINLESKPTPGFHNLANILKHNKKAQNFIRSLPRDRFRVIAHNECSALYPS